MKLRRHPEDFEVLEKSSLPVGQSGSFAVYELQKVGWTTLDALEKLARELGLPRKDIAHAGLKDRHAVTIQRITIRNGPRRSYHDGSLTLAYIGQSNRPVTSDDIKENRFAIVMRSLNDDEKLNASVGLKEVQRAGVPNYFDDQRFGSWFPDKGFIAEAWLRERYEDAFFMAFAQHEPTDSPEEREQKQILRDHWGDWLKCKALLGRSHRRSIVTYLCDHPTDFKRAWSNVNGDLRGLYLSALQSDLWNRIVSARFQQVCSPEQLAPLQLKTGVVYCPRDLTDEQYLELQSEKYPLPSTRVKLDQYPQPELVEKVLANQGWTLPQLKVKFPRDRFFSRAKRSVMIPVRELSGEWGDDEFDAGKASLKLRFGLPPGAYATMIIKRLLTANDAEISASFEDSPEDES